MKQAELSRFTLYPVYKESGIDWLGEIPAHWAVKRLKYLARLNSESLPEDTEPAQQMTYVDIGSVDSLGRITQREQLNFASAPSRARRVVREGDVIVSTVRTYLRAIASIKNPDPGLVVSTGFAVVRPQRLLTTEYAAYALRAPYFVERVVANSKGVSFPAINESELATFELAIPPELEQRAIAAFLDGETTRVDTLVEKKERLIKLLFELRTALITKAVTKGLDPGVAMRDSGVESLEKIPANWSVVRVKTITSEHKQGYYTEEQYVDVGTKLARITDIDDQGNVSFASMPFVNVAEGLEATFSLKEGDFLFARSGTIGRFGVVRKPERAVFASYLIRFRFHSADNEFLRYAFESQYFREGLISSLHGGANQNVHAENIKDQLIALPPIAEQHSIVVFLLHETAKIDKLVRAIRLAVDGLIELRTALVSAGVTGKLDVREELA